MAESEANSEDKISGNQVFLNEKVAALRKEREGDSRTPTPPPHLRHGKVSNATSPTDLLHKKSKKKLEATPWSHPNDTQITPRAQDSQSGAGKSQLSPLASQYGQMTTMEKKTMDRTIHSLLH